MESLWISDELVNSEEEVWGHLDAFNEACMASQYNWQHNDFLHRDWTIPPTQRPFFAPSKLHWNLIFGQGSMF